MNASEAADRYRASILFLILGIAACSTAALLLKSSSQHPLVLSALRLLLAAAVLSPLYFRARRLHHEGTIRADLGRAALPALALALHFGSWAWGAQITPTAQASLIVNLAPVVMPFLLYTILRETVSRRELAATVLAILAVLVFAARDALSADASPLGSFVCFGSMFFFALYLVLGRRHRAVPSLWLYVVPVYLVAGLLCTIVALPFFDAAIALTPKELLLLLGLTLLPTVVGHSLLNRSMRTLPGQFVSLANLGQFVFSAPIAWVLFREIPSTAFLPALLLIGLAVALVVRPAERKPPAEEPAPDES